jgi:hypothetical protein
MPKKAHVIEAAPHIDKAMVEDLLQGLSALGLSVDKEGEEQLCAEMSSSNARVGPSIGRYGYRRALQTMVTLHKDTEGVRSRKQAEMAARLAAQRRGMLYRLGPGWLTVHAVQRDGVCLIVNVLPPVPLAFKGYRLAISRGATWAEALGNFQMGESDWPFIQMKRASQVRKYLKLM